MPSFLPFNIVANIQARATWAVNKIRHKCCWRQTQLLLSAHNMIINLNNTGESTEEPLDQINKSKLNVKLTYKIQ